MNTYIIITRDLGDKNRIFQDEVVSTFSINKLIKIGTIIKKTKNDLFGCDREVIFMELKKK